MYLMWGSVSHSNPSGSRPNMLANGGHSFNSKESTPRETIFFFKLCFDNLMMNNSLGTMATGSSKPTAAAEMAMPHF